MHLVALLFTDRNNRTEWQTATHALPDTVRSGIDTLELYDNQMRDHVTQIPSHCNRFINEAASEARACTNMKRTISCNRMPNRIRNNATIRLPYSAAKNEHHTHPSIRRRGMPGTANLPGRIKKRTICIRVYEETGGARDRRAG